jgi:hypothetical protein
VPLYCGKIIWEEMKHTDIQMPEWMRKLKKHRIVQRDVEKNKKALKFRVFFY